MKIALVLENFDPRRGGLELWTARFAAALAGRGHEVHVVAREVAAEARQLPLVAHPVAGCRSRIEFGEAAVPELLSIAPDVIHDMGAGWFCDVLQPHGGSWTAVFRQKRLAWPAWLRRLKRTVDRLLPRHREIRELVARQYADRGQIVVAVSRMVADDLMRYQGVPAGRVRVVYNGVDTERFSPRNRAAFREPLRRQLAIGQETTAALIVAHQFRLKGVDTALRAVARGRARGMPLHLVVVGGRRCGAWRGRAARLGLGGCVTFTGPQDDAAPYFAAADLYVHPTLYDSCSLVVLEAAASGLPIVTSRFNGAAEMFREGVSQFVLDDPQDAEALADRIGRLADPRLQRRMGRAARQAALEHTFERNVDQMLAVYDEVIARRRAPQPAVSPPVFTPRRAAPREYALAET